jgi:hypothetical protein
MTENAIWMATVNAMFILVLYGIADFAVFQWA